MDLEVTDGEMVAFLGPSGCGKTTTLLMIAGIYRPTEGEIRFDGERVNELPPKDRDIGMVFQSYALYPHMNAYENMVFSLVLKKRPKDEMKREAHRVASMLGIEHLMERRAGELSGGQQQRVALARALIKKPRLLLFDEPLSNLDARLRLSMREEIMRLHYDLGITSVYVTHDQIEAMTMADRIAVLNEGRLQAFMPPEELHERPRTLFVAQFVGSPPMNIFDGEVDSAGGTPRVTLQSGHVFAVPSERVPRLSGSSRSVKFGIRPEDVHIQNDADTKAQVTLVEPMGRDNLVVCDIGGQRVELLEDTGKRTKRGEHVGLAFNMHKAQFFDPDTGNSLLWAEPAAEAVE
jgi:ABC-type sugar transport system ATPase subunit